MQTDHEDWISFIYFFLSVLVPGADLLQSFAAFTKISVSQQFRRAGFDFWLWEIWTCTDWTGSVLARQTNTVMEGWEKLLWISCVSVPFKIHWHTANLMTVMVKLPIFHLTNWIKLIWVIIIFLVLSYSPDSLYGIKVNDLCIQMKRVKKRVFSAYYIFIHTHLELNWWKPENVASYCIDPR